MESDRPRTYGEIDPVQWQAAVEMLRSRMTAETRAAIVAGMRSEGVAAWSGRNHFFFGMHIRNALRYAGFDEAKLGVGDLDNAWYCLVKDAVGM
jgi:hypothetical protein